MLKLSRIIQELGVRIHVSTFGDIRDQIDFITIVLVCWASSKDLKKAMDLKEEKMSQ